MPSRKLLVGGTCRRFRRSGCGEQPARALLRNSSNAELSTHPDRVQSPSAMVKQARWNELISKD